MSAARPPRRRGRQRGPRAARRRPRAVVRPARAARRSAASCSVARARSWRRRCPARAAGGDRGLRGRRRARARDARRARTGVDVSAFRVDAEPTGVSVGLARPGDRAVLTALGALAAFRARTCLTRCSPRPAGCTSRRRSSSRRSTSPRSRPRAAGTTSLDPGWDPSERVGARVERFDVLLPNAQEALRLAGEEDVDAAASAPRRRTVPLVVVKLGAEGALAARRRRGAVRRRGVRPSTRSTRPAPATRSTRVPRRAARAGTGLGAALALGCACGALSTRAAGRHGRAADAGRSAILPRVIAFVAASPSIDRTHVVDALTPGRDPPAGSPWSPSRAARRSTPRAPLHALGADVHAVALLGGTRGRWVAARAGGGGRDLRRACPDRGRRASACRSPTARR